MYMNIAETQDPGSRNRVFWFRFVLFSYSQFNSQSEKEALVSHLQTQRNWVRTYETFGRWEQVTSCG
jgi:hypothetical protein